VGKFDQNICGKLRRIIFVDTVFSRCKFPLVKILNQGGSYMSASGVNYLAVLVAGVAYFLLGGIWYAKPIFGKVWMQASGQTDEQMKASFSIWKMVWAFIGSLIAAYGIARVLSWQAQVDAVRGLMVGLLVGVCFVFTIVTIRDQMESRPGKLTIISVIYNLIGLMMVGLIIGAWR